MYKRILILIHYKTSMTMQKLTYKLRDLPDRLQPFVLYVNGSIEVQMFPKCGHIKRKYKVKQADREPKILYKRSEVNLIWRLK